MEIKQGADDLLVHATRNGWVVTTRARNDWERTGKIADEWVFNDLAEMFTFFEGHFIYEKPDFTTLAKVSDDSSGTSLNPWDTDGSAVYGGGS